MSLIDFIVQDWKANKGNAKGRMVLVLFRLANFCTRHKVYYFLGFLYLLFYKFFVEFILCIEIPWNVKIGKGLTILSGHGLIMNNQVVIGDYCTLRQSTTLGNKQSREGGFTTSPVIGNYVDIGSNSCIIGPVSIGDGVTIEAGSVIVKNVPKGSLVYGNPAVIVKPTSNEK